MFLYYEIWTFSLYILFQVCLKKKKKKKKITCKKQKLHFGFKSLKISVNQIQKLFQYSFFTEYKMIHFRSTNINQIRSFNKQVCF